MNAKVCFCVVLVSGLIAFGVAGCGCHEAKPVAQNPPPVARVEPAPQPPPQQVVEVKPVPPVPESVYFALDKSDITPQGAVTLKNQAEFLKQNPDRKVQIAGNADERGTQEYNQALAQRRADAVKNHLASLGVSQERMTTMSYGKDKPVCTGSTADCNAANRRVDMDVTG